MNDFTIGVSGFGGHGEISLSLSPSGRSSWLFRKAKPRRRPSPPVFIECLTSSSPSVFIECLTSSGDSKLKIFEGFSNIREELEGPVQNLKEFLA